MAETVDFLRSGGQEEEAMKTKKKLAQDMATAMFGKLKYLQHSMWCTPKSQVIHLNPVARI